MNFMWMPSSNLGPKAQGASSLFTLNALSSGVDNQDPAGPPNNVRIDQWIPFDTTLVAWALHTTAGPGVGKTENYKIHKGDGTDYGALVQLTGTNQDVTATPNATIAGLDPTSDTTILNSRVFASAWVTASPNAAGSGWPCFEYTTPAQPEYQWYVCSTAHPLNGASFGAASQYSAMTDSVISSAQTVQSSVQVRMPKAGKLKWAYAAYRGWLNTSTVVATLQKGARAAGADTAIALSMVGHPSSTALFLAIAPLATEVDVADGEYINWRFQRTVGAATAGFISVGVGYKAFVTAPC